jgi:hypothetical protein
MKLGMALTLAIVASIAWVRQAAAQIVNVQGQLAKAPDTDGVTVQGEAKLDWRTGNAPLFDIGGAGAVLVRRGDTLLVAIARGEYGESRGLTLTQKSFEHLRARYRLDCRWRWEAFLQHEYDRFRRLSVRALAGTGPALQIFDEKQFGLLAGAAYLFDFEELDTRAGTIDAGIHTFEHRVSGYLTGVEKLGAQVSIVETVYAQPRLDDASDIRMLGEFSVTTSLSKHVGLTDGLTIAYDRTPPDRVKQLDTTLHIAVTISY